MNKTDASTDTQVTQDAKKSKEGPGVIKRNNLYFIDPRTVDRREGWNPRFHFEDIDLLAASIVSQGMVNPIRVKRKDNGRFELIDGDRRLTAVELALKNHAESKPNGSTFPEGIPAILVDKKQDDVTSLVQMFTANTGKPFLPLEEAAAFKRMKDAGMTLKEIEEKTGASDNRIVGALALLDAAPELQEAVKAGKIRKTVAHSIAVNVRGDAEKQKELTQELQAAGKDKKKKRAVLQKIDDARRAKAAKQIPKRVLKMRALTDEQLSELGAKLAKVFVTKLVDAGKKKDVTEEQLLDWISKDEKLTAAFTFGAMQALKAAAGAKINLDI